MNPATAQIVPGAQARLTVIPEDASGKPGKAPGPLVWAFKDDSSAALGAIVPSLDGTSCLFTSNSKEGVAKIMCAIPSVPTIIPVEGDVTVALPLATQLVMGIQAL